MLEEEGRKFSNKLFSSLMNDDGEMEGKLIYFNIFVIKEKNLRSESRSRLH